MKKSLTVIIALVVLFWTANAKPTPTHRVATNKDAAVNLAFTPSSLMQALVAAGVQHPEIAWSQAVVETGYFTSKMFKKNHNLFGMKLPVYRKTTAIGQRYHHARYANWVESVKDYKLWQTARLKGKLVNVQGYLTNLRKYAADKHYIAKVRKHLPESAALLGLRTASDPREIHIADLGTGKADVEYFGTFLSQLGSRA